MRGPGHASCPLKIAVGARKREKRRSRNQMWHPIVVNTKTKNTHHAQRHPRTTRDRPSGLHDGPPPTRELGCTVVGPQRVHDCAYYRCHGLRGRRERNAFQRPSLPLIERTCLATTQYRATSPERQGCAASTGTRHLPSKVPEFLLAGPRRTRIRNPHFP